VTVVRKWTTLPLCVYNLQVQMCMWSVLCSDW